MVHTRRSSTETIEGKGPLLVARPRRPSTAHTHATHKHPSQHHDASPSVAPAPVAKRKPRVKTPRFRCVAHTGKGTRCRLTTDVAGGKCAVHGIPACLQEERCSICLEGFDDKALLCKKECGHYFHKECVGQWVQVDSAEHAHQMRCPVCRFDVLEGVGAPTPAQIKHMRPSSFSGRAASVVPASAAVPAPLLAPAPHTATRGDSGDVFVDVELGEPAVAHSGTPSFWERVRNMLPSRNNTSGVHRSVQLQQSGEIDVL